MKSRIHALAGIAAIVLVTSFMTATIIVEIIGGDAAVLAVKTAILFALIVLVPSIIVAAASGRSLAANRKSPLLRNKKRRAVAIAVVGIVVLVPCAVTLRILAADHDFSSTFVIVQAVEIAGGIVNLALLSLNVRAGRLLTAARRRRRRKAAAAIGADASITRS